MGRRYVRGDRAFVRLLKQLPDSVTQEIRGQLNQTGQMLLELARRHAPVYSGPPRKGVTPGALQAGLSYSVPPVRLALKVGLVGIAANRKLFYGHIVEFGNQAKTVWVVKGPVSYKVRIAGGRSNAYKQIAKGMGVGYQLRIPARPARHFVYLATREQINAPFQAIWTNALKQAAAGASDD